jgi:hypothetical protein
LTLTTFWNKKKSYRQFVDRAIHDFFKRQQNHRLLKRINKAYGDGLDDEERKIMAGWRGKQRDKLEGEW